MTVQTTTSRADYTGNGVTTAFTVPFYFLDNAHVTVLRTVIATGVTTTLALGTDYTVAGAGVSAGGTVTCTVAPTTAQKLSILRNVPLTQLVHYVPNDPFPAATHEQALDQLTMEVQQVNESLTRAIILPAATTGVSTALPVPASSNFIAWNQAANALVNVDAASFLTVAASSGFTPQIFSGTGSQTAFTLSAAPGAVSNVEVFISGVRQRPTTDYTVSGTTLTFVSAPALGTSNIFVRWGQTLGIGIPSDTSVTTTKLVDGAVTTAKIADQNVTTAKIADANVTPAKMANSGAELGMRNRIINGAMMVDQRNAGASVGTTTLFGNYTLDRWQAEYSVVSKFSVQQNAGSVTLPIGYVNYLGVTSSSAYSVGAAESFGISQNIEGLNVADLGWGAAGASTVTLSFWVRSSLTGTFGGSLRNSAANRSYSFSYTINSANTWEQKFITIAGDTTGTWLTTSGIGIRLFFGLGVGSSVSATTGSWSTGSYTSATGAVSIVGTSGAVFNITGVQLEKGSTATPFEFRPYGNELALCQRYYQQWGSSQFFGSGVFVSSSVAYVTTPMSAPMRSVPSVNTTLSGLQMIGGGVPLTPSVIANVYGGTGPTVGFNFTVSGATAGQGIAAYTNTASLGISAEL